MVNENPSNPNVDGEPAPSSFLERHGALFKHWVVFVAILGVFVAISEWASDWINVRLSEATARWMASIMGLLAEKSEVAGVYVRTSVCHFEIIGECTAFYPCMIFAAAILAFPSPWLRRLLGVVLGVPILLVINQVRLVSLCYITRSFPEHFETIHIVVWQSLIILATVLLWILWVLTVAGRR